MTEHAPTYEPPTLVELGDFADLTLGGIRHLSVDFITSAYGW
ncbi:lasso RiPP family leader peptide-containing protein [Streptomyces ureilyticus]|uniref:Lasso RiPP family leader peptide-containing protein n=1 Tax=Streptomyces ureilyticus TaxID=1775131 RepID=A0ABX0E5K6_9ACTN|nr:lasso RiPP family leader peptide-containing protein [Streptomyces ureilyticus]NGO47843.1 lasso RiPP family leader peptide-containing protein [Streptomyces ureilyticus]